MMVGEEGEPNSSNNEGQRADQQGFKLHPNPKA